MRHVYRVNGILEFSDHSESWHGRHDVAETMTMTSERVRDIEATGAQVYDVRMEMDFNRALFRVEIKYTYDSSVKAS